MTKDEKRRYKKAQAQLRKRLLKRMKLRRKHNH